MPVRLKSIKVAVIGKDNQAAQLRSLAQSVEGVSCVVYYPKDSQGSDFPITQNFDEVLASDAVLIASPTPTHFEYLTRLEQYSGYIFLEKPAVSTRQETESLLAWSPDRKKKIHVNFNLRESEIWGALEIVVKAGSLGQLLFFDVHTSHGLAFQPKYSKSWRNNASLSTGILETVGIHYVDLALNFFKGIKVLSGDFSQVAQKEGPPDTVQLILKSEDGTRVSLRHSYAAPWINSWRLIGTEGYWEYDGEWARTYAPRDTFDAAGRFSKPPLVSERRIPHRDMWIASQKKSLEGFLSKVKENGEFDQQAFDQALLAMNPIFDLAAKNNLKPKAD